MPFQPIAPERKSHSVIRQIENLILNGVLRPGARLPAERELAAKFNVSRPSLREALTDLESRGLIETRPGAGVFVAQVLGSAFAPPLVALFSTHRQALFDYLSFRRDLEGLAAARAATQASDADRALIDGLFCRMESLQGQNNIIEEARIDADFHMAIVEAGHNIVMMHMMRSMFEMLHAGVFYNRQLMFENREIRGPLLEQHRKIRDGILASDPVAARAAIEAHLSFIEEAMRQQILVDGYEKTARQRIALQKGTK